MIYDVIVVGGGTSGVMCAIQASNRGLKVLVLEHNDRLLKKLEASGNGRCNVTNNKSVRDFMKNVHDNSKFFYPIINSFSPHDIIEYFENRQVKLKEENDNKMFPVSNSAKSISDTLVGMLNQVDIRLNTHVKSAKKENDEFIVESLNGIFKSRGLVLCTGGITYQELGSDGSGYTIGKSFMHNITDLKPQECSIEVVNVESQLQGISLQNTIIQVLEGNKIIDQVSHDVIFTHFGLSGPGALNLSFGINTIADLKNIYIRIQLLNMNYEDTRKYLLDIINSNPKKMMKNCLNMLPQRLVELLCKNINVKNSELNKKLISELAHNISEFQYQFKCFYKPEHAFVTGGGVDVKMLKKTLESKLVDNLYFGGEMLDVAAILGGYNITLALSCGYTIGYNILKEN